MDLRRVPLADLKNHQYPKKGQKHTVQTKIDCRHFLFPCQGDKYLVSVHLSEPAFSVWIPARLCSVCAWCLYTSFSSVSSWPRGWSDAADRGFKSRGDLHAWHSGNECQHPSHVGIFLYESEKKKFLLIKGNFFCTILQEFMVVSCNTNLLHCFLL